MDRYHMYELQNAAETLKSPANILLLGSFNPNKDDMLIRDPICGPRSEFEKCYEQISISCDYFMESLLKEDVLK
jgi:hypothetical protein